MSPTSNRDTSQDWEREWRESVTSAIRDLSQQQKESSKQAQETALVLERVSNRLTALEGKPAEQRAQFLSANYGVGTVVTILALLLAFASFLSTHVSWH